MVEEPGLDVETAGVSGERPVRPHHPMTRNDDGNRIGPIGSSDGSRRTRATHARRLFAIRDRGAKGDGAQSLPCRSAKRCSDETDRQIEVATPTLEVFLELGQRLIADGRSPRRHPTAMAPPGLCGRTDRDFDDCVVIDNDDHRAQGAGERLGANRSHIGILELESRHQL